MASNFDSSTTSSDDDTSWITDFCASRGNKFFCRIPDDYIIDRFNAYGLSTCVQHYELATNCILGDRTHPNRSTTNTEHSARHLYGLWHSRYVLSPDGIADIRDKYDLGVFGTCPRFRCNDTHTLPIGVTDEPRKHSVKLYCPACNELFEPKRSRHQAIDGAYFGTGLPHMFFMTYPELRPATSPLSFT